MKIIKKIKKINDKHYSGIITLISILLLAIIILTAVSMEKTKEEEKFRNIQKSPQAVKHNCQIEPFMQTIAKEEEIDFKVRLNPSYKNSKFNIRTGELPKGVTADIVQGEGEGIGILKPRLNIKSAKEALNGSYSLVIFYDETQADGKILTTNCQYNLVIQ